MARRRGSNASVGAGNRTTLSSRRFDDSIQELTTESIEQSLREIEKVFQQKFGETKRRRQRAPAPETRADT